VYGLDDLPVRLKGQATTHEENVFALRVYLQCLEEQKDEEGQRQDHVSTKDARGRASKYVGIDEPKMRELLEEFGKTGKVPDKLREPRGRGTSKEGRRFGRLTKEEIGRVCIECRRLRLQVGKAVYLSDLQGFCRDSLGKAIGQSTLRKTLRRMGFCFRK
jgi:hypothetical protein